MHPAVDCANSSLAWSKNGTHGHCAHDKLNDPKVVQYCGFEGQLMNLLHSPIATVHADRWPQLSPGIWIGDCLANGTSTHGWTQPLLHSFLGFLDILNIISITIWCSAEMPCPDVDEHCPWMYMELRAWKTRPARHLVLKSDDIDNGDAVLGKPPAAAFSVEWLGSWRLAHCNTPAGCTEPWPSALPIASGQPEFARRVFLFSTALGYLPFINSTGGLVNGGLPQSPAFDLSRHLSKVRADLHDFVRRAGGAAPGGSAISAGQAYCCIDWEFWYPLLELGSNVRYFNASMELARRGNPTASEAELAGIAVRAFDSAAQTLWLETLRTAQSAVPACSWGYYGLPRIFNMDGGYSDEDRAMHDRLGPLIRASDALFPSVYLHFKSRAASASDFNFAKNSWLIRSTIQEGIRMLNETASTAPRRGGLGGRREVVPWVWFQYMTNAPELAIRGAAVDSIDMALQLTGAAEEGCDTVLMYEDGTTEGALLANATALLGGTIAPRAQALAATAAICRAASCGGNGHCVANATACRCDTGYNGQHCRSVDIRRAAKDISLKTDDSETVCYSCTETSLQEQLDPDAATETDEIEETEELTQLNSEEGKLCEESLNESSTSCSDMASTTRRAHVNVWVTMLAAIFWLLFVGGMAVGCWRVYQDPERLCYMCRNQNLWSLITSLLVIGAMLLNAKFYPDMRLDWFDSHFTVSDLLLVPGLLLLLQRFCNIGETYPWGEPDTSCCSSPFRNPFRGGLFLQRLKQHMRRTQVFWWCFGLSVVLSDSIYTDRLQLPAKLKAIVDNKMTSLISLERCWRF